MKNSITFISFILLATSLFAQTFWDKGICKQFDPEENQRSIENTKLYYPEVYNLMLEKQLLKVAEITTDTLGTKKSFFVSNDVTEAFDNVEAELRFIGTQTRIWVSVAEWANGHVNQNVVDDLSDALENSTPAGSKDPSKGIVDLINQYYGDFPNYDGDKLTDFLVCDIQDGWVAGSKKGYTKGFFYPWDQTTGVGSNRMDLLYLDSYPAIYSPGTNTTSTTGVLGTSAHELQHLVHYNYDKNEITFLDEGMSTMAKWICGYPFRSPDYYFQNHNIPLLDWETVSKNSLYDYSRAALFSMFITEQFGTDILKDLVQNTKVGEAAYNEEFQKRNPVMNLKQMFKDFCYANYIQDKTVKVNWGYDYNVPGRPNPKARIDYPNTYSGVYSLNDYSVAYFKIGSQNFDDTLKVTPEAVDGEAYRINFNNGADPNVEIVTLFQEETIPNFKASYDSLVYVIFNFNGTEKDYAITVNGTDNNTYWNQVVLEPELYASGLWTFANGYFIAGSASSWELYISKDNGATWGIYSIPSAVNDIYYDDSTDKYIIGTNDGVFSSDTTFSTWTEIGNLERTVFAVTTDPDGNVFAGTLDKIYKAQLTAGNWVQFNNGITDEGWGGWGIADFAVDKDGSVFAFQPFNSVIYKLPLNGTIWTQVHSGPYSLKSLYDGVDNNIYAIFTDDLYKYSNNGEDWVKQHLEYINQTNGISINPNNSNELFLAHSLAGTYHSIDGGTSWTKRNNGFSRNAGATLISHNNKGAIVAYAGYISYSLYTFNTSITGIDDKEELSQHYSLEHNYPNPFNPSTTIEYSLVAPGKVSLIIYNILGEKVNTLVNEFKPAGNYKVHFNAAQLSSGVYFYQLRTGNFVDTKKMILIK